MHTTTTTSTTTTTALRTISHVTAQTRMWANPNVMAALPNIGGALCSTLQSAVWLRPTTRVPCSTAAKTRNPLKFAGAPQTRQQISAVSRPKFTILSGRVEEVRKFNKFFRLSIHASAAKIQPDKVVRWCQAIFASCIFSEPRVAHFRHAF